VGGYNISIYFASAIASVISMLLHDIYISRSVHVYRGRRVDAAPLPVTTEFNFVANTHSERMVPMNGISDSPKLGSNVEGAAIDKRASSALLVSLPEILSALSSLESEEAELSSSLSDLLSAQEPILTSLLRIHSILPHIHELRSEAYVLSHKVSATARTAERVGGRVRALDEEMRRVREANERVGQVMDLKVCTVTPQMYPSHIHVMYKVFLDCLTNSH